MNRSNLSPAYLRHLGTLDLFRMSGWIFATVIATGCCIHFSDTGRVADFSIALIAGLIAIIAGCSVVIHFQSALEYFDEADVKDGIKSPEDFSPTDWTVDGEDHE